MGPRPQYGRKFWCFFLGQQTGGWGRKGEMGGRGAGKGHHLGHPSRGSPAGLHPQRGGRQWWCQAGWGLTPRHSGFPRGVLEWGPTCAQSLRANPHCLTKLAELAGVMQQQSCCILPGCHKNKSLVVTNPAVNNDSDILCARCELSSLSLDVSISAAPDIPSLVLTQTWCK